MRDLGATFKNRLSSLLGGDYDPDLFQIRSTNYQRNVDSALAFMDGMFPGADVVIPEPIDSDPLLRVRVSLL